MFGECDFMVFSPLSSFHGLVSISGVFMQEKMGGVNSVTGLHFTCLWSYPNFILLYIVLNYILLFGYV